MASFDHPAVVAAIEQLGQGLEPLIAEVTDDVVAVVLADDTVKRTIIIERVGDEWPLPSMMGGTPRRVRPRSETTVPYEPFVDVGWSGMGWPAPDGGPPEVAWHALTGVAARDIVSVVVLTPEDEVEASVEADGRFLALLRGPWGGQPAVQVRTKAGDLMPVSL